MVIDTSAILAILFNEPERQRFAELLEAAEVRLVSAVTRVEAAFVVEGRQREAERERLDRFFRMTDPEIVPVTPEQAEIAIEAFRRFGRGRHPAALNIGDCFAYALARATGETLLYKGGDFARTDIESAIKH
ncbi:MAG: type II toxin-antitoxin system VapC family toxin [Alphaproteobacteria bacterium]